MKKVLFLFLFIPSVCYSQASNKDYQLNALRNDLEYVVEEIQELNENTVQKIKVTVLDRGQKPAEVKLADFAEELNKKTNEVLKVIHIIQKELLTNHSDSHEDYLLGKSKDGKVYKLIEVIDGLRRWVESQERMIAFNFLLPKDGTQDPFSNSFSNLRKQDFAELNFSNTSLDLSVIGLSRIKLDLMLSEKSALDHLSGRVGASDFKFDAIHIMAMPENSIVPAGMEYNARILLTATTSLDQDFRWNHLGSKKQPIKVPENDINFGIANISFRASGGGYDKNGLTKKKYFANITFKGPTGMVTLTDTFEYYVKKPLIKLDYSIGNNLYKNCENVINTYSPDLNEQYNPSYKISGGYTVRAVNEKSNKVTIVPTEDKATLVVASNGMFMDKVAFNALEPPKPTITVYSNEEKSNLQSTLIPLKEIPSTLSVTLVSDSAFKILLPQDARYYFSECNIILHRNDKIISELNTIDGVINTKSLTKKAQPGDVLIISIDHVTRKNFLGKVYAVDMTERERTLVFILTE